MPNLIMLIGNIGSGKSSLAKLLVQKDYIAISRDGIRYAIREGGYLFDIDIEHIVFKTEWFMLTEFMEYGSDIVLDEINVSKRMRLKYLALAKDMGYKTIAFVFPRLSKEESITRRLSSNHGNTTRETWEKVWENFEKTYEEPLKSEGFTKIIHCKGDR
jgi:predicted kinase